MSRRPALRHRSARRTPSILAALCLIAGGGAVVWAVVENLAYNAWPGWLDTAAEAVSSQTWQSPWVIGAAAALGVLGLICLIAAVKPGLPSAWRIDPTVAGLDASTSQGHEFVISRRGVAKLAAARADLVDGVDQVSAQARRRTVRLSVTMPATEGPSAAQSAASIRDEVTRTVHEALVASGIPKPVVRTTVR